MSQTISGSYAIGVWCRARHRSNGRRSPPPSPPSQQRHSGPFCPGHRPDKQSPQPERPARVGTSTTQSARQCLRQSQIAGKQSLPGRAGVMRGQGTDTAVLDWQTDDLLGLMWRGENSVFVAPGAGCRAGPRVPVSPMTRRTILASTWPVRPAASRRSIPVATALHTKTSGAAAPMHSAGRAPPPAFAG
jgi:hypothetical protein